MIPAGEALPWDLLVDDMPGDPYGIPDPIGTDKKVLTTSPFFSDYGHIPIGEFFYHIDLVGTGYAKKKCGTALPDKAGVCSNKPGTHKPVLIPNHCNRRICPVCWTHWAEQAGKRGADILNGYLTAKYGPEQKALPGMDRDLMLPRHFSFHPPRRIINILIDEVKKEIAKPSDFQRVFLRKLRDMARNIIESAGGQGGLMVIHEIRLCDDQADLQGDLRLSTNRYRQVLDRRDWRDHVKYYPHIHVLIFGAIENARDFEERTGWTYRNHRVVHEPEKAIHYLLSHASAATRINAITPFGCCSQRSLAKVKEYRYREYIRCDECIDEGVDPDNAIRVVGTLDPHSLVYENSNDPLARLSGGLGKLIRWSIDDITPRHFARVHRVGVYEIVRPGHRVRREKDPTYLGEDWWTKYLREGVIPGSWFDPGGAGGGPHEPDN